MSYTTLKIELDGEIGTITLNRPDKRNAISPAMIDDLLGALDETERGPARVVILTGAGKAFCAGMDLEALRELASQTHEQHVADAERMGKMFHRVYSFPKPLIAAVNGAAIAGGTGLATLAARGVSTGIDAKSLAVACALTGQIREAYAHEVDAPKPN